MVRLEDLKLVDVTLWKLANVLVATPSWRPITRTTNSPNGGASNSTKKLPLSCGVTTPSVSSDPSDSTRETSVSVMLPFPDTVSNKLTLAPFLRKKGNHVKSDVFYGVLVHSFSIVTVFITRSGTCFKSGESADWTL